MVSRPDQRHPSEIGGWQDRSRSPQRARVWVFQPTYEPRVPYMGRRLVGSTNLSPSIPSGWRPRAMRIGQCSPSRQLALHSTRCPIAHPARPNPPRPVYVCVQRAGACAVTAMVGRRAHISQGMSVVPHRSPIAALCACACEPPPAPGTATAQAHTAPRPRPAKGGAHSSERPRLARGADGGLPGLRYGASNRAPPAFTPKRLAH